MINVFIIDDHKMVIDGLQLMLKSVEDIETIGYALNGEDGIAKVKLLQPDIILLDINMDGLNGIDTCKMLHNECPNCKVIAISMHKESSLIKLMLGNGAKGYVLKNAGQDEVITAIKTVYEGKTYLGESVNDIIINSITQTEKSKRISNTFPTLSRRERDVLELILKEYTTQEIADKLFISFGTVETHRRNMLTKTGARNTAGLVRIAIEYNLLDNTTSS